MYKQTAIQLHSQKVPTGLKLSEKEITGLIEYQKVEQDFYFRSVKDKVTS